jgi:transketolase
VEAGVTHLWYRYVGLQGKVLGIDRFGLSAPGPAAMKELGMTVEQILLEARRMM